jgi:hypothetical protein
MLEDESTELFAHNNIERSTTRVWKKTFLNTVMRQCKTAGYEVRTTSTLIVIGLVETDQIFLRALKGPNGWLTRYDRKLFDEDAE